MLREPPRQVLVRVGALLGRALQSAIHDTEGGYEVLVRARGSGRVVALRRSEPPVCPDCRALGLAEELLQPVVAKLRCEVPQLEHVVEEVVHRGPSRRVVAGYGAELRLRVLGPSPEQKISAHVAPAERHEATHRALSPGGRWRAASCTAWR